MPGGPCGPPGVPAGPRGPDWLIKMPRSLPRHLPVLESRSKPLPGFFDLTQAKKPVWAGALPLPSAAKAQKAASASSAPRRVLCRLEQMAKVPENWKLAICVRFGRALAPKAEDARIAVRRTRGVACGDRGAQLGGAEVARDHEAGRLVQGQGLSADLAGGEDRRVDDRA